MVRPIILYDNALQLEYGRIYWNSQSAAFYSDRQCQDQITRVDIPTREGYTFAKYTSGTGSATTEYVNASGVISTSWTPATGMTAVNIYAQWTANTYIVNFDYNGGTGTTEQMTVTFGQPVGALPTASRARATFIGWKIDGEEVTATTPYTVPRNAIAVATYDLQFGNVTDWFGFASSSLKPIASDSGDNKQRICCAHTGKYESGVGDVSGIWRNPTVTYVVTKNTTLSVQLGKAYRESSGVSGYMIVGVKVNTRVGAFPTVIVQATANEGADAINKFNLTVAIEARSKAQNLMNAISGGGKLNTCVLSAACEPVVLGENMMPCASDVVNGRVEITAKTIAANNENAPSATAGFVSIGEPKGETEAYYKIYTITAQKEM